ncbi:MAG: hydrogenase maturation protease [Myxococcales bacterium]|nr:hydrogenase maturation protease [Myxococcales bacterium]
MRPIPAELPATPPRTDGSAADAVASLAAVTVVGAGHSVLAHDRVGPQALGLLAGRFGPDVELCELGTSGLALLDHLHRQALLVVVDACLFGGAPGTVRELVPDIAVPPPPSTSVHQIGPLEALYVARHVCPELLPERTLLVLVETEGIDDATEARACAEVAAIVEREVRALPLARAGAAGPP